MKLTKAMASTRRNGFHQKECAGACLKLYVQGLGGGKTRRNISRYSFFFRHCVGSPVFWRDCVGKSYESIIGYESIVNRLRIGERVDWMVCHFDCKCFHKKRPLLAIINFLSLSDEDSYYHLHQKKSEFTFLAILPVLEIAFPSVFYCTTSVVLHNVALQ